MRVGQQLVAPETAAPRVVAPRGVSPGACASQTGMNNRRQPWRRLYSRMNGRSSDCNAVVDSTAMSTLGWSSSIAALTVPLGVFGGSTRHSIPACRMHDCRPSNQISAVMLAGLHHQHAIAGAAVLPSFVASSSRLRACPVSTMTGSALFERKIARRVWRSLLSVGRLQRPLAEMSNGKRHRLFERRVPPRRILQNAGGGGAATTDGVLITWHSRLRCR